MDCPPKSHEHIPTENMQDVLEKALRGDPTLSSPMQDQKIKRNTGQI